MSAFVTIGGLDVVDMRLSMPRAGVWICEASLADDQKPKGAVDVVVGPSTLRGFVSMAETAYGATVVRVVGGAGGMGTTAKPQHYLNTTVRLILNALLATAGEKLSPKADAGLLNATLTSWAVMARPVGREVAQLMASRTSDATWRILPDGTFWCGAERWPKVEPEHDLLTENPLDNTFTISSLEKLILPGDLFLGRKVSYVEHTLLGGHIRSTIRRE